MDKPDQPDQEGATGGAGRGGKRRRSGRGKSNSPPKSDTSTPDVSATSSLSDVTTPLQDLKIAPASADVEQITQCKLYPVFVFGVAIVQNFSMCSSFSCPWYDHTIDSQSDDLTYILYHVCIFIGAAIPAATPLANISVHTDKNLFPPARPDSGKLGKRINLLVNYFALEVAGGEVVQYDVRVFTEDMVKRKGK